MSDAPTDETGSAQGWLTSVEECVKQLRSWLKHWDAPSYSDASLNELDLCLEELDKFLPKAKDDLMGSNDADAAEILRNLFHELDITKKANVNASHSIVDRLEHVFSSKEDEEIRRITATIKSATAQLGKRLRSLRYTRAREKVRSKDPKLLDRLDAVLRDGKAPWRRARMMIVGAGRVGKTTLFRRLKFDSANKYEGSTKGADQEDITYTKLPTPLVGQEQSATPECEEVEQHNAQSTMVTPAESQGPAEPPPGPDDVAVPIGSRHESWSYTKRTKQGKSRTVPREEGVLGTGVSQEIASDVVIDASESSGREWDEQAFFAEEARDMLAAHTCVTRVPTGASTTQVSQNNPPEPTSLAAQQPQGGHAEVSASEEEGLDSEQERESVGEDEVEVAEKVVENMNQQLEDVLRFNVWDFGGQRVFHTIHHLFFARRGVYLVVFSCLAWIKTRDDARRNLEFWLHSIAWHANGAPALVIGTRAQSVSSEQRASIADDINELVEECGVEALERTPEGIVFWAVDNFDNRNITYKELWTAITHGVDADPYKNINTPSPQTWMNVMSILMDSKLKDHRRFVQFEDVHRQLTTLNSNLGKETTESETEEFLETMKDFGLVCYFHSNSPGNQNCHIILDPQWFYNLITSIVRNFPWHRMVRDRVAWTNGKNWDGTPNAYTDDTGEKLWDDLTVNGILDDRLLPSLWLDEGCTKGDADEVLKIMFDLLLIAKKPERASRGRRRCVKYIVTSLLPFGKVDSPLFHPLKKRRACLIKFGYLPSGFFPKVLASLLQSNCCEPMFDGSLARSQAFFRYSLAGESEPKMLPLAFCITEHLSNDTISIVMETPDSASKTVVFDFVQRHIRDIVNTMYRPGLQQPKPYEEGDYTDALDTCDDDIFDDDPQNTEYFGAGGMEGSASLLGGERVVSDLLAQLAAKEMRDWLDVEALPSVRADVRERVLTKLCNSGANLDDLESARDGGSLENWLNKINLEDHIKRSIIDEIRVWRRDPKTNKILAVVCDACDTSALDIVNADRDCKAILDCVQHPVVQGVLWSRIPSKVQQLLKVSKSTCKIVHIVAHESPWVFESILDLHSDLHALGSSNDGGALGPYCLILNICNSTKEALKLKCPRRFISCWDGFVKTEHAAAFVEGFYQTFFQGAGAPRLERLETIVGARVVQENDDLTRSATSILINMLREHPQFAASYIAGVNGMERYLKSSLVDRRRRAKNKFRNLPPLPILPQLIKGSNVLLTCAFNPVEPRFEITLRNISQVKNNKSFGGPCVTPPPKGNSEEGRHEEVADTPPDPSQRPFLARGFSEVDNGRSQDNGGLSEEATACGLSLTKISILPRSFSELGNCLPAEEVSVSVLPPTTPGRLMHPADGRDELNSADSSASPKHPYESLAETLGTAVSVLESFDSSTSSKLTKFFPHLGGALGLVRGIYDVLKAIDKLEEVEVKLARECEYATNQITLALSKVKRQGVPELTDPAYRGLCMATEDLSKTLEDSLNSLANARDTEEGQSVPWLSAKFPRTFHFVSRTSQALNQIPALEKHCFEVNEAAKRLHSWYQDYHSSRLETALGRFFGWLSFRFDRANERQPPPRGHQPEATVVD